ncbi:MAG: hypothetical protein GXO48_01575 [Chlorobi bacterium]|nr:hypothetical protein [Chlorobiota bacterium]
MKNLLNGTDEIKRSGTCVRIVKSITTTMHTIEFLWRLLIIFVLNLLFVVLVFPYLPEGPAKNLTEVGLPSVLLASLFATTLLTIVKRATKKRFLIIMAVLFLLTSFPVMMLLTVDKDTQFAYAEVVIALMSFGPLFVGSTISSLLLIMESLNCNWFCTISLVFTINLITFLVLIAFIEALVHLAVTLSAKLVKNS